MKAQRIHVVLVLASVFAAFVLYLCLPLMDIMPLILAVLFVAAVYLVIRTPAARSFVSIKLCTQKTE